MKHLISLKEQSKEDILKILEIAQKLKAKRNSGELTNYLPNQTLIMLFQKTSTRTRLSFEVAMTELGGHSIFLDSRTSQFSLADFRDEIQAVMRYGDVLMFRAIKAGDVEKAAFFNKIPVIDACSEKYHPAQALSDLLTMAEHSQGIENVKKIVWLGIKNNVSNTLMLACAKLGIQVAIVAPEIDQDSVDEELNQMAEATGKVTYTLDLAEALKDADYVHTDTWMNMEFFQGEKIKPEYMLEYEKRKKTFIPYQLNTQLISTYAPQAKIMHCMPCHVGYEISRDAIDHPNSVIFDQAENRLHAQKAMILWLLDKEIPDHTENP
jgi:ornithine carbamoyltransferase